MATSTTRRLAAYQRRYRQIAEQIADIGFIASGSVTQRYTRCGTPTCACHADPPRRHGPYWQWTAKVDGKTVTRRLTPTEAALYKQWIANDRQLRQLTTQMRDIAAKATDLTLKDAQRT
jgi:hypothetical protein